MNNSMHRRWRELSPKLDVVLDLPDAQRAPWLASLRIADLEMAALVEQALEIRDREGFGEFLAGPPPPFCARRHANLSSAVDYNEGW